MTWREIQLGDAIHIKHGYAFKSQFFAETGDFVVLTPGNFHEEGGFRLRPEKDRAYVGDVPEGYVLAEGDLIVAMTEQGPGLLGSSAQIPESDRYLHNQRLGLIDAIDSAQFDKRFLYYLFNTYFVRGQISGSASGTKVRHTSPDRIYGVRVSVPDVITQQAIASFLFTYDDLIENNRRRIALLEEAARQLYREWFVRLRFPGNEHTRIIDGVPEGWSTEKLVGLLDKVPTRKKIAKQDYLPDGSIPCVDQSAEYIGGYTDDLEAVYASPLPLIVFGDHTRALKFVNFPFARGADGTQIIYPKAGIVSVEYLYFALREIDLSNYFYARHFKFLKEQEVLIPESSVVREFTVTANLCFEQIRTLRDQVRHLREARDLLLPRLMSGEIAV